MSLCQHYSHGGANFATYGLENESPQWCALHAPETAVDQGGVKCDDPSHGTPGAKAWYGTPTGPAMKCCTHREDGMVCKANLKCIHPDCTAAIESFGFLTEIPAEATHGFPGFVETVSGENAIENMVDYSALVCDYSFDEETCSNPAEYGFAGEIPSRCALHQLPNTKKTRRVWQLIPESQAVLGFPGEVATRCSKHGEPGMVRIR